MKSQQFLSTNLILIGLSGTEMNSVIVPTFSPEYSMRYLCTILAIIMYSSSLANLCPMQALGHKKLSSSIKYTCPNLPGSMAKWNVGKGVCIVSFWTSSQPSFRKKLFRVGKIGRVIRAYTATPNNCCPFWYGVPSDNKIFISASTASKCCRRYSLAFCLTSLQILHLSQC